jgi:superfamily II RNA helicase
VKASGQSLQGSYVSNAHQRAQLERAAAQITDTNLRGASVCLHTNVCVRVAHVLCCTACIVKGVGCHHAGLSGGDRALVESLFAERAIAVLCTTRTLALGVNLPAHLVIIKSMNYYSQARGSNVPYTDMEVLQVCVRACGW